MEITPASKCASCTYLIDDDASPACSTFHYILKPGETVPGHRSGYFFAFSTVTARGVINLSPLLPERSITIVSCREYSPARRRDAYRKYLKLPEWKLRAKLAIQRADYKCERCGSPFNLAVHHLTYEHLGHERPEDLVVLCRNCHSAIHGYNCSRQEEP